MSHVDNTKHPPSIISICSGVGGIEKGLAWALGCEPEVAAYVETEAFIVENLLVAMEEGVLAPSPIWTDLRSFDFKPFRGRICGLVGGYPCQGFSLAGLRKGEDDSRYLWPFIREGIRAAEFIFCFFENVDDHLTLGFDTVYKDLRELGYLVEDGIYSSEEVGAPHERQRLYILAVRQEMAYTNGYDPGRIFDNVLRTQRESVIEENKRQRHRDEPGARGQALADAGSIAIHESRGHQQSKQLEPDGVPGRDELEHANSCDQQLLPGVGGEPAGQEQCRPGVAGTELENTPGIRIRGRGQRGKGGRTRAGEAEGPGRQMVDTPGLGCEGHPDEHGGDREAQDRAGEWRGLAGADTTFRGWPMGQGPEQYPYEAPRTVESGMVYNINGYGFMGDLHRAIGNSVSPHVAATAFIDLIHKHIKSANYGNQKKH